MRLNVGFDIDYDVQSPTTLLYLLRIHEQDRHKLVGDETVTVSVEGGHEFSDAFANRFGRLTVPAGVLNVRLQGSAVVQVPDEPDPVVESAVQHPLDELPDEVLRYLKPSRYCEVDSELMQVAWDTFGSIEPGWARVQAVCTWVHEHLQFDYLQARANRTALEGFREKVGVCRDFTHLFVTLCRCLNIPTQYVAGYLGDIGVPADPEPMDFSAWSRVYLGGQWHAFDPRHDQRRLGRVLIGVGRDAADIPIVTAFGPTWLNRFDVVTTEA